jgi:hypothetical protein
MMNLNGVKEIVRGVADATTKNSPTILTALGVTGLVGTVVLAVRGTLKADQLLGDDAARRQVELATDAEPYPEIQPLSKMEVAKLVWPCYVPTILMGGVTIACIIGANSISLRRNAVLASAYALADKSLKNYQDAVVEQIGKGKEEKVRGTVAQNELDKHPIEKSEIILTGKGETLFYEYLTGRYFKSDIELVRRSVNDFNSDLIKEEKKPLNDFLLQLGLEDAGIGESLGWTMTTGLMDVIFSPKMATDGNPCIMLSYSRNPVQIW